ncbi:unnamed protein product [Schistocephalus solidus]|uniref:Uncharacterized protein n=1 Tax=Schistocephalus solidus TaxID=70667 RepID=A0A183SJB3_SCHSO|nr:unnamed protein product [Schistocephalus solidus]
MPYFSLVVFVVSALGRDVARQEHGSQTIALHSSENPVNPLMVWPALRRLLVEPEFEDRHLHLPLRHPCLRLQHLSDGDATLLCNDRHSPRFSPDKKALSALPTGLSSQLFRYYVSPCWAPAGQPPPLQQQQQFDETGQLVGLNASTVSTCGPGMPTANRRLVQQPPPIPNPGLAAPPTPTLDPRYVPSNLPHASPHPMYHSVNNICIPPTAGPFLKHENHYRLWCGSQGLLSRTAMCTFRYFESVRQPAYLMHDTGAPLNHDLANFGPLGPAGLSPTSGQPRVFMPSAAATAAAQFRLSMDPRSAVAALQLRPSGAGCCFPVSGVGNGVSAASGPMPAVDPNGLRPPFGSEPLVSTPPRKAAEPRKKRAKATKMQLHTLRSQPGLPIHAGATGGLMYIAPVLTLNELSKRQCVAKADAAAASAATLLWLVRGRARRGVPLLCNVHLLIARQLAKHRCRK